MPSPREQVRLLATLHAVARDKRGYVVPVKKAKVVIPSKEQLAPPTAEAMP
ncbi:MAG: hypothetical protein RL095_3520 [Verrucomicrobiota bacterium]|jgi:hypothetical protein